MKSFTKRLLKRLGYIQRSYEQVRREQTSYGGVDYNAYDLLAKEQFVINSHGTDIKCEYIPPIPAFGAAMKPKCVIHIHGLTQNRLISVRFMAVFRRLGYASVIYDQRGFGESGGFCTLGFYERHDAAEIVKYVRGKLGEDCIIGFHGESLGAITLLSALSLSDNIAFAVEDSAGTSVYSMFRRRFHLPPFPLLSAVNLYIRRKFGVDLRTVRPIDAVRNTDTPILFLHGNKDTEIPVEECPDLYAAAKNPLSKMYIFDACAHCEAHAKYTEEYEKNITDFVKEAENNLNLYYTEEEYV